MQAKPAPAPEQAPAPVAAPILAAPAAPAPGPRGNTQALPQGSQALHQGAAARAEVPQIGAPQRLNTEPATARLPVVTAIDALSVQQQVTHSTRGLVSLDHNSGTPQPQDWTQKGSRPWRACLVTTCC